MGAETALTSAVDLLHLPSRARALRRQPLPAGMDQVLAVVAGDRESVREASSTLQQPEEVVRRAAGFFVEQVLFEPEADSYRVLGATPAADAEELRRNMALLLRWLHPDTDSAAGSSPYATRVTNAWNDLKTPERRAAYDRARAGGKSEAGQGTRRTRRPSPGRARARPADAGRGWTMPGALVTSEPDRDRHGGGEGRGMITWLRRWLKRDR